jgi:hypothetical protein
MVPKFSPSRSRTTPTTHADSEKRMPPNHDDSLACSVFFEYFRLKLAYILYNLLAVRGSLLLNSVAEGPDG